MITIEEELKQFKDKLIHLQSEFEEVNPLDFFNDVFPKGAFQVKGNLDEKKPNGLAVTISGNKGKHYIITEDRDIIHELLEEDFVITSPISYFGNRKTSRNSSLMYGMAFDLDGVSLEALENLLHQIKHNQNPLPTYIVNSGHGLHLYYIFKEPIKLYEHIKEPLKNMKFELTDRLWNIYTSDLKEKQFQGIFQGFRMVGSPTKFGKDFRVTAFRTGNKIDMDFMNSYVKEETKILDLNYRPKRSLEEAKKDFPEWYERKIVQGITTKKTWNIKRDLYDWWKKKIIVEASFGHRYFCLMVLAIYAKKCNIPYEELEKDSYELMPILNEKHKEPFTEIDVQSALKSYEEDYRTFPRKDIEKLTAISMPANKRNYRTQDMHLKGARAIQEINNPNWRNENGAPTKETQIHLWRSKNPKGTKAECIRDTGISKMTVYKWWDTEPEFIELREDDYHNFYTEEDVILK